MPGRLQFGIYELDRDAMELRKNGNPVRLQEQPLRILLALVERPGVILPREELRERVWGKETFVDFEQSLNKAVNRLREALNDDANQPNYVETVPRRGYRFISPVIEQIERCGPPPPSDPVPSLKPKLPMHRSSRVVTFSVTITLCALVALGVAVVEFRKRVETRPQAESKLITSAAICCPRLSRDGKLLAYVSNNDDGLNHVWVQQPAGAQPIQVTNGPDGETAADFSPDGTHI